MVFVVVGLGVLMGVGVGVVLVVGVVSWRGMVKAGSDGRQDLYPWRHWCPCPCPHPCAVSTCTHTSASTSADKSESISGESGSGGGGGSASTGAGLRPLSLPLVRAVEHHRGGSGGLPCQVQTVRQSDSQAVV